MNAPSPSSSGETAGVGTPSAPLRAPLLFLSVLVIATCGLIYELVAGTLASYLLGDSVTQFSTIIGLYLSAMGIGSYLSRFIQRGIAHRFVDIELAVALVGGFSAPALFVSFSYTDHFRLLLYGVVLTIGTLVGLEIPLLLRLLKNELEFKDLVSQVLTFDYIGALFASILFPLICVPRLGLMRTSLLFGLLNAAVGLWSTYLLRARLGATTFLRLRCVAVIILLFFGLVNADRFTTLMEDQVYSGEIVFARSSSYQRIVVTRDQSGFQLFLNGNLQFNSVDEYRYHEALVHPAFSARPTASRILVCGGGDGLALREILRYPQVKEVWLVDLDPAMTEIGATLPLLTDLNHEAYKDPRVRVLNEDAMVWLDQARELPLFDLAIVDFPDPNNFALGKLYTTRFYHLLKRHVSPQGAIVVQSTSPLFTRISYWCIVHTMEAAGLQILPYHLSVPSFGEWGFVLASATPLELPRTTLPGLSYLNDATLQGMFIFPRDMERVPAEVNRLNNQVLVQYYEAEWRRWN